MQQSTEVDPGVLGQAVAAHQAGQLESAMQGYRRVLASDPGHVHANANLALILHQQGDLEGARRHLEAALDTDPTETALLNNLGAVHLAAGRDAAAESCFRRVLALKPDQADALSNLGEALVRQGRSDAGLAQFREALRVQPDHVNARAALGQALWGAGQCDEGYRELARASALAPFHAPIDTLLQNIQTAGTRAMGWHFPMLNDTRRNQVYRAAIERQVRPGMLVLEIGAGAGLLAMIAARAGAEVVSFEVLPDLAAMAREIVAANGLSERITIVDKFSFLGQVGVDLPRPADLLVCEIFDAGLIGEEVLRSIGHARRSLLAPGAAVLPRGARLYGQLIECERLVHRQRVGEVEGFDLSAFNRFAPRRMLVEEMRHIPYRPLGPAVELFRFDFQGEPALSGRSRQQFRASESGAAVGFMLWFELDLGAGDSGPLRYSSAPGEAGGHWGQRMQLLERLRPVQAGEMLTLDAEYLRSAVFVDLV